MLERVLGYARGFCVFKSQRCLGQCISNVIVVLRLVKNIKKDA